MIQWQFNIQVVSANCYNINYIFCSYSRTETNKANVASVSFKMQIPSQVSLENTWIKLEVFLLGIQVLKYSSASVEIFLKDLNYTQRISVIEQSFITDQRTDRKNDGWWHRRWQNKLDYKITENTFIATKVCG